MRCKNCKYSYFDITDGCKLCSLFGYGDHSDNKGRRIITVNSKGEEGCRYRGKSLDKMNATHQVIQEYLEFMEQEFNNDTKANT